MPAMFMNNNLRHNHQSNPWSYLWQRKILQILIVFFVIHQIYLFISWTNFFHRNSSLDDVVDDNLELPYGHKKSLHDDHIDVDGEEAPLPFENYFKYFLPENYKSNYKNTWDETKLFNPENCDDDDEGCKVVMPEFIILGAQKCGTTSLWKYLLQHPQVLPLTEKARVIGQKEIRFFDEKGGSNETHPLGMYMKYFTRVYELERLGRAKNMRLISGEGTPNYIRHPFTPQRIKGLLPNIKLIALFREPVDRAYSQFQHAVRVDRDNRYTGGRPYEDFVDAEIRILKKCMHLIEYWPDFSTCYMKQTTVESESLKIPAVNQKRLTWCLQTILRSLYSRQLMNYARFFAPDQILVVQSEEFYEHTDRVMRRIEDFLGLGHVNWNSTFNKKEIFNFGKGNEIFVSEKNQQYEPLPANVRRKMEKIFAPFNRELVRMFSDRGFKGWSYDNDKFD